jgi:hypothetical protein
VAANAGQAIFSEKPIALDLAETERIVKVVRERKVPVQLGFMRRYDPGYAKAKAKIEAGRAGKAGDLPGLEPGHLPAQLGVFVRKRRTLLGHGGTRPGSGSVSGGRSG